MNKQYRDKELDGLRGLAALSVALGHCNTLTTGFDVWAKKIVDFPNMTFAQILGRLGHVLFPADAAVIVFFVLSGYVLWGSLIRRETNSAMDVVPYMLSRFYRLLPVSIICAIIFAFFLPATALDVARNGLLLGINMNPVLWSLQVEVVASLLLFLGFLGIRKHFIFFAPLLVIIYFRAQQSLGLTTFFIPFFLGAGLRYLPAQLFQRASVGVAAYCMLIFAELLILKPGYSLIVRYVSGWLLVGAVLHKKFKFLNSPMSQFLGDVSYPFYLVHPIAVNVTNKIFDYFNVASTNQFVMFMLLALFSIGIALPISWLVHVFVEKPCITAGASVVKTVKEWQERMSEFFVRTVMRRRQGTILQSNAN